MDTSHNVGECSALGQLLCNADVQGREFAEAMLLKSPNVSAWGLACFFKAIADGDSAFANSLLRSWGIRR